MVKIETDRLILRDYKETDLDDMHRLWSDEKTMFYLDDILCRTIKNTKRYLKIGMENTDGHYFCICEKGSDRFIGSIGYAITSTTPLGKIVHMGYMMMPEYHGRGYMTEATKKVIEFAFTEDGCIRITTGCVKEHEASRKVMEKAGFRKEGERVKAQFHDGVMKDRLEYAINKEDFESGMPVYENTTCDMMGLVSSFILKHKLQPDVNIRFIDLVAEIGELGGDIVKATEYGQNGFSVTTQIADETGDCLFSLFALCHAMGIDAKSTLADTIEKYEKRFAEKGSISSGK